ncbi:hypothetical protein B0H13DRAFT_1924869 [Mycena leptocephala]|nr:hypothetical protein B0H13DRAFT_1924869 [Mycena leptocephala]
MALPTTSRALSPFDGLIQTALIESTSLPLNADTDESRDTIENDSIARRRRLVRRVLFVKPKKPLTDADLPIPRLRSTKLVRRVTTSPVRKVVSPMKTQSPVTVKMLEKRARMDDMDGEVEDSVPFKHRKLGRIQESAEKENIDLWSVHL